MNKYEKKFFLKVIEKLRKYLKDVTFKLIRYKDNHAIQIIQKNKSFILDGVIIDKEYTIMILYKKIEKWLSE